MRGDVAVDDAQRLPVAVVLRVRGVEAGAGLRGDARGEASIERRHLGARLEQLDEGVAVHPLHHEEEDLPFLAQLGRISQTFG